ncbi:MAG: thiamine diphosphokinase [Bacteroidales bacterium]|nr:thiamine diphosphokinase [Bacteroidales bacterium]
MTTVILADGEFPLRPSLLAILGETERVVCCDHGYKKWLRFAKAHPIKAKEVYAVGDFDTLEPRSPKGDVKFYHYAGQDDNDLTKSVHFCFEHGWMELVILAATGLREDHTLGNISLLAEYLREQPLSKIEMLTDFGHMRALSGKHSIDSFPSQQVSLFSMVPGKRLSVRGLQYPIENRTLDNWWQGTLNSALANSFMVEVEEGGIVIVFQTHDTKEEEIKAKR